MPRKPVAELYTALGYDKHGKTELYRDLLRHLAALGRPLRGGARRGAAWSCSSSRCPATTSSSRSSATPSRPPRPRRRRDVLDNYRLVFRHDRARAGSWTCRSSSTSPSPATASSPRSSTSCSRSASETVEVARRRGGAPAPLHGAPPHAARPLPPRGAPRTARASAVLDFGEAIRDLARDQHLPRRPAPRRTSASRGTGASSSTTTTRSSC